MDPTVRNWNPWGLAPVKMTGAFNNVLTAVVKISTLLGMKYVAGLPRCQMLSARPRDKIWVRKAWVFMRNLQRVYDVINSVQ